MTTSGQLPRLDAPAVTLAIELPKHPATPADEPNVPAAPGVIVFESADGATLLLATTADARSFVRTRLGMGRSTGERPWRVDHRPLTARILVFRVGSSLEAEAVYLAQARARTPQASAVIAERWRAWFAHTDPGSEFPEWTRTNLLGLVATRSAGKARPSPVGNAGLFLGPLPDKDAAGRFLEAVVDAFDLCRFHHLLALAPRAPACAYKEMGRCPAPCDGSESIDSYRRRVAEVSEMLAEGGVARAIAETEAEMSAAVARSEFERAAALGRRTRGLRALAKPAFSSVRSLERWRELLVLPGADRGRMTLALFDRGMLYRVADLSPADSAGIEAAAARADRCLNTPPQTGPPAFDADAIATIGVVSRWMFRSTRRRRGEAVRRSAGRFDPELIARAARSIVRAKRTEAEFETHESADA